jgi:hypothetical protein
VRSSSAIHPPIRQGTRFTPVLPPKRHSGSFLLARGLFLVMLATALDVWNYLDRGGWPRYLLLLVPLVSLLLVRLRDPSPYIRRPGPGDRILLGLLVYGLVGSIYGIVVLGTSATALPIFLPMPIAFLYLSCLETPSDRETWQVLRGIEWLGLIYLGLGAVVSSGLVPGLVEFRQFRNATLVFAALGLGATMTQRHWWRAGLVVGLWAAVFVSYPSGTSVLAALTVVFTLLMMPRRISRVRPYLLGAVGAAAVVIVVLNFSTWVQLSNDYFSLVGKSNNNSSRLAVWTVGLERFGESPVYGQFFSGPTVTTAVREGGLNEFQIPYHSDYIHFLANGGLIGFGLLLTWMVATELAVLRRYTGFLETGQVSKASLLRALLVAYNAFFVTAAFNPTFTGVSRSATIFSMYALMMAVGSPRRREA